MSTAGDSKTATIYDVAEVAGVSPSTVSRAFSRPGRVSTATAKRVREVAEQLGYRREHVQHTRPDGAVRTHALCLVVSDVTNTVFSPIIRGAESAAAAAGYVVLLADAQEQDGLERRLVERSMPLTDGFVIASSRLSDTELRSLAKTAPVVVLNRVVPGLPSVIPDTGRGVRRAIEHLVTLGHSRNTYIAGPEASWADGSRWRAVREASMELDLTEHRVGPVEPTVAGGRAAARAVVERGDGAVIAYNDLVAMGLIMGLRELGVQVPNDVSVIGFDNIFGSDLITPPLTTVAAPLTKLGETATQHLVALATGKATVRERPTVLPVRLLERGSTGPAPSGRRR